MKSLDSSKEGFSLIEVVLALAVATFGIVAMMGLFSTGLAADRQSKSDTLIASMAQREISDLQSQINQGAAASGQLTLTSTPIVYFDGNGQPPPTASDQYYRCAVQITDPYSATTPAVTNASPNVWMVTLTFAWPSVGGTAGPFKKVFYVTLRPPS